MKFTRVSLEEQETHIWIDYYEKKLKLYTSRQAVYTRLVKKIGDPDKVETLNGKITGAKWEIPFNSEYIVKVVKKGILIGNFKKE